MESLKYLMIEAVNKRTKNIPFDSSNESKVHDAVSIMFSGGLDSTLIAAIACKVLPSDISVDLINVSFAPATSADRFTAIFSFQDLKRLFPDRKLRMICADYSMDTLFSQEDLILNLCQPKSSLMDFNIAAALHFASKSEGYVFDEAFFESDAFSKLLHSMDSASGEHGSKDKGSYDYGVITNKITSIDPSLYYKTLNSHPLWTKSTAKVVFSGLGADEVWAGYSRYKTAMTKGGIPSLKAEMSLDLNRLWHRNMGRDDRAISYNGKEARFPFLDTRVQEYLR